MNTPPLPPDYSQSPGNQAIPRRVAVHIPQVPPLVTYSLMAVTVVAFAIQWLGQQQAGFGTDVFSMWGRKSNLEILQGEYWRLITPVFLHGSILHLGFNLYALFIFGRELERFFGHWRFLGLYFLAAFAGNVVSFWFTPAPSVGSSTAIFGLLAAQGVFLYRNRRLFGSVAQMDLINILVVAGINLYWGLQPGIDNWGHIGGMIGGLLFAWMGGPLLYVKGEIPPYQLADHHSIRDIIRAGVLVLIIFTILAVIPVLLHLGSGAG